jgi:hypothetical protein
MRELQYRTRSDSRNEAPINNRHTGNNAKTGWQSIKLANTVNIVNIFRHYDIHLDEHTKKVCCPLPLHNERSASFYYYPNTNSFFCFGCKQGGGPVELVAHMNGCEKENAARHILSQFGSDVRVGEISECDDYKERQSLLIKFATIIRSYIYLHVNEEAFDRAEKITYVFDELNNRNNISNEGLAQLIEKLERKLLNA